MAQAPPGYTCTDQPNKDKGKGKGKRRVIFSPSSPNDGPPQTIPSTDQASHSSSSSPVPYHSPTSDQGEHIDEIVTYRSACTPSPHREHSYAHEAPDPEPDHTYKKRRIIVKKRKKMRIKKKQRDQNQP